LPRDFKKRPEHAYLYGPPLTFMRWNDNAHGPLGLRAAGGVKLDRRGRLLAKVPQNGLLELARNGGHERADGAGLFLDAHCEIRSNAGQMEMVPRQISPQHFSRDAIASDQNPHHYLTNRTLTVPVPEAVCKYATVLPDMNR
jgi:hypothetical protein